MQEVPLLLNFLSFSGEERLLLKKIKTRLSQYTTTSCLPSIHPFLVIIVDVSLSLSLFLSRERAQEEKVYENCSSSNFFFDVIRNYCSLLLSTHHQCRRYWRQKQWFRWWYDNENFFLLSRSLSTFVMFLLWFYLVFFVFYAFCELNSIFYSIIGEGVYFFVIFFLKSTFESSLKSE